MNQHAPPRADAPLGALLADCGLERAGERLDLRRAALGREAMASRTAALREALGANAPPPVWWDEREARLALRGAELQRAQLDGADLSGADLGAARLAGAVGRGMRLDGALIEETDFTGADLSGASFAGAVAGQAVLAQAMLEDATFARAAMRFAKLPGALLDGADFAEADLWGADFNGADADNTVFRGARLDEARLADVNLTHADFTGASLKLADLSGSRLRGAQFAGARLDGAKLRGADLSNTTLVRLNLSSCDLTHVRLAGAWIEGSRMSVEQLGGMVGEERAGDFEAAAQSYRALETNLSSIGAKDEASWAYKRSRLMGRRAAGQKAVASWRAGRRREALAAGYRWAADRSVEWLCDYGESMSRIVRAFALLIVVFAALYGLSAGLVPTGAAQGTRHVVDLMSYSALNMMTANPPAIGLDPVGRWTNILVGLQGAVGIILMGLFGFVLGNRIRR
ncbi:pentapeptide repeat-containing protein [Aureimonas jatrophae]|uniref:Uncharacterized protein YjbI, contains pentapeptide repeats n=1 Tax=Aureimonas jatrophae TaxID=1166073 RepID=A0A1H0K0U4_9HYPH|nr:pentapeptide repeat-containing protein [Aureimonas jatrophae]MBB3950896.1 uncharacterized protein YjbI with pentapeptide repeats [Aureimonas jatrophae]SDO49615.1 Uncharacterized protein YjbI, contains pentapeptide repeats [Aureimonas jatrophae]